MEMNLTKNRFLTGIVAGIVVLLLLWMIFSTSPVSVETAGVESGEMLVTVDGEGKTRLKDKVTVTAPVSGKMSRIKLREGDPISKEYVITQIDPNPPAPRPPSETENLINPYALKVYAPISGRVLRILQKDERILPAGTPIIEIGNSGTAEIVVDVLSTDAAQIRPGASVFIESETNAEPIKARVRTVEPQAFTKVSALGVEEQRVNIIADFLTKNTSLGDNFRVDVRIIVWQSENVLKIPSSALFRNGEKWNVFVAEAGKAQKREVSVGHQTSSESEILEGLSEGETVVLHPPNQLTNGTSVKSQ
jgi:multidrug efflux pump subunit AcrA (membrane-fusion protein)